MTARRILVSLLVTLLFAAGGGPLQAAVPADLAKLLPSDPPVLVVISSAADFDAEWAAVLDAAGADPEVPRSLADVLGENMSGFAQVLDPARPMAVAMDVAAIMMGGGPAVDFVFPIRGDLAQLDYSGAETFASLHQEGDYAVLSTREQYTPAAGLAAQPMDGVVSMSIDIQGTLGQFMPFAAMGLGQLAMAQPDSNGVMGEPAMTQEQVAALADGLQKLVAAMKRFEIVLRRDGDHLLALDRLTVTPGGPLAPGPQPDFADALALTGLLPAGGDLYQASALDLTRPFELLKPLYVANFNAGLKDLPPEAQAAAAAWFEDYLSLIDWTAAPMASGAKLAEDGASVHILLRSADAATVMTGLTGLADRLADMDMPYGLTALPAADVAGVKVHSYDVVMDVSSLADAGASPEDLAELETMQSFLRKIVPQLHLAQVGDLVVLCADDDPAALAQVIGSARKGKGKPVASVAAAAKRTGADTRQAAAGDMASFLRWTLGMAEAMGEEDAAGFDAADLGAVQCEITTGVTPDGYTGSLAMKRDDVLRLVKVMAELDDDQ